MDTQLLDCQRIAEGKSLALVLKYTDVESGLKFDRPQYQLMLEAARNREFDYLIVWCMDRLGRDTADYFTALKTLRQYDIIVLSATEPTEGEFVQGLFGILGEEESRRLSHRIIPNKQARAREGKWNGMPPCGYDVVPAPDGKGSILSPNDDAPMVVEMFRQYAEGRTSISHLSLYTQQQGRHLGRGAISELLRNPAYLGKISYGRRSKPRFSPASAPVVVDGLHPPLLSSDLFNQVQEKLERHRHRKRGGPRPTYLLSGLLRCGQCGSAMVGRQPLGKRFQRYECCRRNTHLDCNQRSLTALKIEPKVKAEIRRLLDLLQTKDVVDGIREAAVSSLDDDQRAREITRKNLNQRAGRAESRLRALEVALIDVFIPPDRFAIHRDEIMPEKLQIDRSQAEVAPLPEDVEWLVDLVVADEIWDKLDNAAWRDLVERLIDRVVLTGEDVRVEWLPACRPLLGFM